MSCWLTNPAVLFSLPSSRSCLQLREVLEKFLDDDSDMKDLNLTAKVRPGGSHTSCRMRIGLTQRSLRPALPCP